MSFLPDPGEQQEPSLSEDAAVEGRDAGGDYFIAKTYGYLLAALAVMTLTGVGSYRYLPRSWLGAFSAADGAIWLLCLRYEWRQPLGLVFPLFTVATGVELGELAHLYPAVFGSAAAMTLLAFGGLSLFVLLMGRKFSAWGAFLCLAVIIACAALFLSRRYHEHSALFGWTGFCVALCGGAIVYDTSQTMLGSDGGLMPGLAAFELILDLVLAQNWIVEYLGRTKTSEE